MFEMISQIIKSDTYNEYIEKSVSHAVLPRNTDICPSAYGKNADLKPRI